MNELTNTTGYSSTLQNTVTTSYKYPYGTISTCTPLFIPRAMTTDEMLTALLSKALKLTKPYSKLAKQQILALGLTLNTTPKD